MKRRPAFTIVELVIVIAVIGVLSGVLIPIIINVVHSAQMADDKAFVRNINTTLAMNESRDYGSRARNMYEAIEQGKIAGYDIDKHQTADGYDFIYDQKAARFAVVSVNFDPNAVDMDLVLASDGHIVGRGVELWKRYSDMPENQTFSIYAKADWNLAHKVIDNLQVGFDEGDAMITSITYDRHAATSSQSVSIRTFGSNLTINAPLDEVTHYEWVNELNITAVNDADCYIECGYVEDLQSFVSGKFIAESSAKFHQSRAVIEERIGENPSEIAFLSAFDVPFYDVQATSADNHFIVDEQGNYPEPVHGEYSEVEDELGDADPNDLSALYTAFEGINNYTSETQSYFKRNGAYDYFRRYRTNCVQHKKEIFTENAYYIYPMDSLYNDVCNFGYLNYAGNCTSFALNGSTVSARLASSLIRTDLRLVESDATFQERLFTLGDLTSAYLDDFSISRIGQHTYECSDEKFMEKALSIVAPNLNNRGWFIIPERIRIELGQPGDEYAFRFRLYISHLNYGALIDEHRVDEYPSWKYLFAEATISKVGTTAFSSANGLLNLG